MSGGNFFSFQKRILACWTLVWPKYSMDFPGGSDDKVSVYSVGVPGSVFGSGKSPEKEMATHSNILAWKIPWTEEPARLQSMGWQRVGHN